MENRLDLSNMLFLDIETVSCVSDYYLLNERLKPLWDKKAAFLRNEEEFSAEELFVKRAAIYAEFGKIVTIAVGFISNDEQGQPTLRVKAFASDDEKEILEDFKALVMNKFDQKKLMLCAHNGKEFDFPYMCRRYLINGIPLPECLSLSGKKPWEVNHIDTMEMWKFGDKKSYTSLELLAAIFDVPSSKDDVHGSIVTEVYYEAKELARIAKYCMQDVAVTAQLFLKMNCLPPIDNNQVFLVE